MGAGSLRVLAKFHRNTCYRADLSGDYGGSNFIGRQCRSGKEFVYSSLPIAITTLSSNVATEFEFAFAANSFIPIDVSDLYLQVIFSGRLGDEDDALAVTTENVAEPNYIALGNMTDYVYDDGGDKHYHRVPYKLTVADVPLRDITLAIAGKPPLATMPLLRGGQHAQFAFLSSVKELPVELRYNGGVGVDGTVQANEFALDDAEIEYKRSCPVFYARGVYREYLYFLSQNASDHGISIKTLSGSRAAVTSKEGAVSKIDYACTVSNTGIADFSSMDPYGIESATPWSVSF
jgi:hypothetical protein